MFEESLSKNKAFRQLNVYERLNRGEKLFKEALASDFGVSLKTIQRDIDDLRIYLSEMHFDEETTTIKYDRANNYYYLVRCEKEWLTNEGALSLCKILLESRAFKKEEMAGIIEKLILHIHPADRSRIEQMIRSELFHYIPLKHNKSLLSPVWDLSENIIAAVEDETIGEPETTGFSVKENTIVQSLEAETEDRSGLPGTEEPETEETADVMSSTPAVITSASYTVKKGDNLAAICRAKYGNTDRIQEVIAMNHLENPNHLYPGQKIIFPDE